MTVSHGFGGRRRAQRTDLPPGQYDAGREWPVLTAEVTPHLDPKAWTKSPVPVFRTLAPQGQAYPMFGVLVLLAAAIGLPFLVVSTSAPLLTRWFNLTGHPASKDPYFLYAASNAGSLLSLVAYPLVMTFSLVYAGEHYVIDCLAGALLAVGVHAGANRIERRRIPAKPLVTLDPCPTQTHSSPGTMPSSTSASAAVSSSPRVRSTAGRDPRGTTGRSGWS